MQTQKIINLLNDSSNKEQKFATKKWYVIDSQTTKGKYKQGNVNKFETETIKSSLFFYSDVSGSLWQFKRDEVPVGSADLSIDTSQSFKYKAAFSGKTADAVNNTNSSVKEARIVVALKYLSNFWRSLEMPLTHCKVYLELNWIEDCILSSAGDTAKFAITDTKLHVSIVTLSTKDSASLGK